MFSLVVFRFKVVQNGCWQKMNFERNEPLLESTGDSHFTQESPWVHPFTSAGRQHTATSHDLREHGARCCRGIRVKGKSIVSYGLARSSEQHPACHHCHQDFVDSTIGINASSGILSLACILIA